MKSNVQSAALAVSDSRNLIAAPPGRKPMTMNEKRVYQALHKSATPMKAYALLEQLQDAGIRAPMTVYRALDSLIDRGVVKKVTSLNAFAVTNEEGAQSIGAFVTCRRCGQTREVCLSEAAIIGMLAPAGITVDDIFIEAYGDCGQPSCANAP